MNILEKICNTKRRHVENMKKQSSFDELRDMIDSLPLPSGFLNAMKRKKGEALIAEVKKASPSKGVIREDFDHVKIAKIYEDNGAACLSVLTDEPFFQGHDEFLIDVKQEVNIPVLRKDFIIDPYQVFEARMIGADCILLIMAILDDKMARKLYETAIGLKLDVLVEVHNMEELERALKLDPMMIGVNNRNLSTLEVDVQTSYDLLQSIPSHCIKVSESGISSNENINNLSEAGYDGFLVGESLMKQDDIAKAVNDILSTQKITRTS